MHLYCLQKRREMLHKLYYKTKFEKCNIFVTFSTITKVLVLYPFDFQRVTGVYTRAGRKDPGRTLKFFFLILRG